MGKLLVLPGLARIACRALELDPLTTAACTFFNGLPASPSSYVMSRQMGGHYRLMAAILTFQTVISALTIPLLLVYQS